MGKALGPLALLLVIFTSACGSSQPSALPGHPGSVAPPRALAGPASKIAGLHCFISTGADDNPKPPFLAATLSLTNVSSEPRTYTVTIGGFSNGVETAQGTTTTPVVPASGSVFTGLDGQVAGLVASCKVTEVTSEISG
jgi:hypothetical protein